MQPTEGLAAIAAAAAEGMSAPDAPTPSTQDRGPETAALPDLDAIREEARMAERTRLCALDAISLPGCEDIITAAKDAGAGLEATALEMVRHLKATDALNVTAALSTAAETVPALSDAPHDPAAAPAAPAQNTPDAWRAEYARSSDLQNEFSSADTYAAFRKAHAEGRVRIYKGG
jgi:hypothetical protein